MANEAMELSIELSKPGKQADASLFRDIPIRIRNASSIGFRSADVSVKDEGSGEIASVTFGRIEPNRTEVRNASLPGGVEQAAYNIYPDEGEKIFGLGFADNATEVNITIRD
ncbi:hypothetical protein [Sinorhizobium medicae]|uniref:hypothetical protein n=1 Tax=Sinorhizobium medicae TaxID=110321 RepID=UPI000FDBCDDF|nr:hypothetical protein [Sinorhizobium medicae]RVP50017.1 hypothetical protein CN078_21500 [Sinorhizobium medicae]RVP74864.1 hypothetical protein CN079_21050 [Sinorhizobium medicae]UWU09405.1 hypothetical protein N2598_06600 [Sinorhizobium medicae]